MLKDHGRNRHAGDLAVSVLGAYVKRESPLSTGTDERIVFASKAQIKTETIIKWKTKNCTNTASLQTSAPFSLLSIWLLIVSFISVFM